jgi:hypothetical protein
LAQAERRRRVAATIAGVGLASWILWQAQAHAQSVLFFDDFDGPDLNVAFGSSFPDGPLGSGGGNLTYLGEPNYSFESLNGDSVLRMSSTLDRAKRRGWATNTAYGTKDFRFEARFNVLLQGPTTSIDSFIECWLIDAGDPFRFVFAGPHGQGYGTSRQFRSGGSIDNQYKTQFINYADNNWYRLVIDGSPGQNIRASLFNDDGTTELVGRTFDFSASAFSHGLRIGLAQATGGPDGSYPLDVAIDWMRLTTSAAPEPSSLFLLILCGMFGVRAVHRRRQVSNKRSDVTTFSRVRAISPIAMRPAWMAPSPKPLRLLTSAKTAQVLCLGYCLSLGCTTHAAVISTVETDKAPVGVFGVRYTPTFPSGGPPSSDLLQGKLPSDSAGDFKREGAAGLAALTNGSVATFYGPPSATANHSAYATAGDGQYVVYDLGGPHNISSIVVFSGWNDNGRDAQHYDLLTSADGATFSFLATADANFIGQNTEYSTPASNRVTFRDDAQRYLAPNVTHLRLNFLTVEAGYTGYSEIDVFSVPAPEPPFGLLVVFGAALGGLAVRRRQLGPMAPMGSNGSVKSQHRTLVVALMVAAIGLALASGAAQLNAEQPYNVAWVRQFGTSAQDVGRGLAADGNGNVYITGYTKGALAAPNPSGQDAPFFAKYDGAGNPEWVRQLTNNVAGFQGVKVATDSLGNIFLTTSLGGQSSSPVVPNRLHSYDADGNVKWSADFPLPQNGAGVVADNLGYAYVSTYELVTEYPGNGFTFINLRKFDAQTGGVVWTRSLQVGGTPNNTSGVSYDGLGNIYVAAYTSGSLIGPNAGGTDALIAKYALNGDFVWARQFGSAANDNNFQVAADALGNVWSTGGTFGDLGGPYLGGQDVYLANHNADGNLQWIRHLGTSGEEVSGKVWADGLGHVYLATSTNGLLGSASFGSDDIVVAKYDAAGNQLWIKQFGTSGSDLPSGAGITGDAMGNFYVTGYTTGSWGGPNAGGQDVVLIKLSPAPEPTALAMAVVALALLAPSYCIRIANFQIFVDRRAPPCPPHNKPRRLTVPKPAGEALAANENPHRPKPSSSGSFMRCVFRRSASNSVSRPIPHMEKSHEQNLPVARPHGHPAAGGNRSTPCKSGSRRRQRRRLLVGLRPGHRGAQ